MILLFLIFTDNSNYKELEIRIEFIKKTSSSK